MATKTGKSGKRGGRKRSAPAAKPRGGTTKGTFVCSVCGFEAKHAMGLGRHSSARHGVKSQAAKRAAAAAKQTGGARGGTTKGTFVCSTCGFVAKHAMGLGRHRSARHGVQSKAATKKGSASTSQPVDATGEWIPRRQAAAIAGIHYNTLRLWEQRGTVKTRKSGNRTMVRAADIHKAAASKGRAAAPTAAPTAAPSAASAPSVATGTELVEVRAMLTALADGLEQLARQIRPAKRRGRPPRR